MALAALLGGAVVSINQSVTNHTKNPQSEAQPSASPSPASRPPASRPPAVQNQDSDIGIIIGGSISAGLILIVVVGLFLLRRRYLSKKKRVVYWRASDCSSAPVLARKLDWSSETHVTEASER